MRTFKNLMFLVLLLTAFTANSQNSSKKQYSYSFEGSLNAGTIEQLEQKLNATRYVTAAKIKYKADSAKGEALIEVSEAPKANEGDNGFDLIALKKLLQSFQLTPGELRLIEN